LREKFGASLSRATFQFAVFRIVALPTTMLMIFLIYWRLPNRKIPMKRLIPASAVVAVLLEVSKYLNILTWPWLRAKLEREVPPFVQSITIVLWSFTATLILLTGAEWSARAKMDDLDKPGENSPDSGPVHPSTRPCGYHQDKFH